jgi:hypothetical protein
MAEEPDVSAKILALDLETSPNLAHVWGLWQQNVSLSQLLGSTEVICFGARWLGKKAVTFRSVHHNGKEQMLRDLHALLDEADAVMGWNSKGFDSKHMKREFLEAGLTPPSPYKELDLMLACKKHFRFPSFKLDYVAQRLGVGAKVKHEGHGLWIKCLAGDDAAWKRMKRYQIQDVNLLIDLYDKLLPWLGSTLPNANLYGDGTRVCPKCGVDALQRRGFYHLATGTYPRNWCDTAKGGCGGWSRDTNRVNASTVVAV